MGTGWFLNRAKASLDVFWLRYESLEESDNLPDPDVLAHEIVGDLEARSNNSAKSPQKKINRCVSIQSSNKLSERLCGYVWGCQ